MPAKTHQFPCLSDNFGVLIHDPATGATASIDAPEAAPIEAIGKWGFIERPSYGIPFNVSDHPALSACCGFGRQGLPLAIQLVCRRNEEQLLLRAGHAYECAAGWRGIRPPLGQVPAVVE